MLSRYLIAYILLLFVSKANAQHYSNNNIQFNHFSADHRLSQTVFHAIVQDKKGYIWFGTNNGLIKFDGYTFTTFQYDLHNKNSIQSNYAGGLCEDSDGNIWVIDYGIIKYDQHTGNFTTWHHDVKNKFSLPTDNENSALVDKNGKLWIGTGDAGVCFYESSSNRFISLSEIIYPDTLCNQGISCMIMDRNGSLWIGTLNGINIYDPVHKKLSVFNPPDKNYAAMNKSVSCMMEDHSGDIWIALWTSGIYRYTPSTGASKIYQHSNNDPNSLSINLVNTLMEDSHQNILAGMEFGGICAYHPATDNFTTYRGDVNNTHALSSDKIEKIFEDRSGVLWIGAIGAGLNNCYLNEKKFKVYQNWDKDYVTHCPLCLYKSFNGKIYMTTHGTGLQEFNPATGKFISHNVVLPNDSIGFGNVCTGVLEASDGNFWMVSYGEGLHKYNFKTRKFTTIHSINDDHLKSFKPKGYCIVEDINKRFWIGTTHGLKCYDLKTKTFSGFEKMYPDTNMLSSEVIHSLYLDSEGVMWIAGSKIVASRGGLTLFNTKTGKVKVFLHNDNNPHSISDNTLNCFYDDGNGTVWIGTEGGGLNRFNKKSEQFIAYTKQDGLPSNSIRGILADDHGNLWLSSNEGICKFTPPSLKNSKAVCRNYDMSDGLPGDDYNFNSCIKADDGTLYFAGSAGLVAFKPDELKDNQFIPPVVVTDLSVLNQSVTPNDSIGILKISIDETKEIKLSYKQNIVSFTFAALNYLHPEKNQYAYKLDNFDKTWIYTDASKRFATYTNLDPGSYTFEIKGSNNDGVWNEKPTLLHLIITPPYWQTWWFYTLCACVFVFIFYSIYRYRLQQIIKLQNIRNKISGDLHDDIGSTLNSISVYSEVAKQDASKHAQALEMIGEASRKIIDAMSDIVWTINPENDSFENIILRMRSLAFNLLRSKNIEFTFRADESLNDLKLSMESRRNFFLIFKEAINNLVKYADATGVSIQLLHEGSFIKLIVRDNGKGFDTSNSSNGNGLNNMKRRAKEMKGQLQIESQIGNGTAVALILKP